MDRVGTIPSFVFNRVQTQGYSPGSALQVTGSTSGVPNNDQLGTNAPAGVPSGAHAAAYGQAVAAAPVGQGPLIWIFGVLALSVIMLAHVARVEVK